ncbi:MAG: HU family DNA-binding protein [Bacteroidaceae bacterium]|nr:HU family DNA-binding protein [Bacteroidaceae bacterium]MDO4995136.1 HU family DNA-binding protein [Bacteroidales bacterium]
MYKMMFKVGPKKVGLGGKNLRYVARPFYAARLSDRDILCSVARNYAGLTKGEVFSVCDAVANEFRNHLFMGHTVRLMGLGTFRVSFDSVSKERRSEVKAEDISHPRVLFTPEPELLDELRNETKYVEEGKED